MTETPGPGVSFCHSKIKMPETRGASRFLGHVTSLPQMGVPLFGRYSPTDDLSGLSSDRLHLVTASLPLGQTASASSSDASYVTAKLPSVGQTEAPGQISNLHEVSHTSAPPVSRQARSARRLSDLFPVGR